MCLLVWFVFCVSATLECSGFAVVGSLGSVGAMFVLFVVESILPPVLTQLPTGVAVPVLSAVEVCTCA